MSGQSLRTQSRRPRYCLRVHDIHSGDLKRATDVHQSRAVPDDLVAERQLVPAQMMRFSQQGQQVSELIRTMDVDRDQDLT